MEAEYIGRETVIKSLEKLCDRVCQYSKAQRYVMCSSCPLGDAFTVIEDDITPADVRPVLRGHWERVEGDSRFMCSVCKCKEHVPTIMGKPTVWDYCPNCGADMRGGDAE